MEVGQNSSSFQEISSRSMEHGSLRSNSRLSTNRESTRCFMCRYYDQLAKDCPNMKTADSSQPGQLQQLIGTEGEDISLM